MRELSEVLFRHGVVCPGGVFFSAKDPEMKLMTALLQDGSPTKVPMPTHAPKLRGLPFRLVTKSPVILNLGANAKVVSFIVEGVPVLVVHPHSRGRAHQESPERLASIVFLMGVPDSTFYNPAILDALGLPRKF